MSEDFQQEIAKRWNMAPEGSEREVRTDLDPQRKPKKRKTFSIPPAPQWGVEWLFRTLEELLAYSRDSWVKHFRPKKEIIAKQ